MAAKMLTYYCIVIYNPTFRYIWQKEETPVTLNTWLFPIHCDIDFYEYEYYKT